jgi:predicted alpha/beta hydrolase
MENAKVRKTSTGQDFVSLTPSSGGHRLMAGMFDLSVLILGSVIIMVPSLLVFIAAMRHPSTSRTIAVYVIMFLTGLWWRCTTWPIGLPSRISTTGNRLGQRFYRMRLYQDDGGEVRFRSLLIKALTIFFLVIFSLGLYYFVEAIALFVSPSHRGFADVVSSTIVSDTDEDE